MSKLIILSFDIPRDKASLRVKIWRILNDIGAEQKLNSNWVLPFNQRNLADMKTISKEIISSGGNSIVIIGERVV